nr:ImmA/IrrE family metallo-endopeptidase [Mycobacteroides abscessus]
MPEETMSRSKSLKPSEGWLEPTRIRLARHRVGLTKATLAQHLGVTVRTVTNYETEGAPAPAGPALATALDCQLEFLMRPPVDALEADRVFFRARRRASAAQRHAAVAAGRIGIELYEWIAARFGLPELDVPELDHLDPHTAALTLRAMWGLGTRPLPNLVQLAESRGIRVLSLPSGAAAVDAFSVWAQHAPYAFITADKTPERSRFDLAHEIGHLVLHSQRGVGAEGVEREADQFASTFLMPDESLRTVLGHNPSVDEILAARTYYKVSAMAVNYAVLRGGRCTDWSYRQNCIHLSQRGFRTAEPGGMPAHERSRVFGTVFNRPELTHRAAAELGTTPQSIHTLTFGAAICTVGLTDQVFTAAAPRTRSEPQLVATGRHLRAL